jgi:putative transposase
MAESLEQLDLLLPTVAKARTIPPDGIRFRGMRYIDPMLAAYVGETVLLRYDPRDVGEVWLFHQETLAEGNCVVARRGGEEAGGKTRS